MNAHASLLVVDDEDVVCRSCHRIFERAGFAVETCTDPREGLRRAVARDYNAILLDLMMPDLSGLEFLEQLRAVRPDVPVIVITGYASVPSAAEAMRLRAADYVPKPFTPDEITQAVRRVVSWPGDKAKAAAAGQRGAGSLSPTGADGSTTHADAPAGATVPAERAVPKKAERQATLFAGSSWMRLLPDGSYLAGAFLSVEEAARAERVRVADPGETVAQGLPLAEITIEGGQKLIVHAPADGSVVEVNAKLLEAPAEALRDPCETGWVARLRPEAPIAEPKGCAVRRVCLASRDDTLSRRMKARLEHLGCLVETARDATAARAALAKSKGAVLMIDADSMTAEGPELVRSVAAASPGTNVVVLASQGAAYELLFRTERVFYYAVAPVSDAELIDILHSAFREAPKAEPVRRPSSALEPSLRAFRVRTRTGKAVTLLTSGRLLFADRGIGALVQQSLLAESYPVETTVGPGELTTGDIAAALPTSDRVLVLWMLDTGRIPGSLVRCPVPLDTRSGRRVETTLLIVQPAPGKDPMGFDARTTQGLARVLVSELTGERDGESAGG